MDKDVQTANIFHSLSLNIARERRNNAEDKLPRNKSNSDQTESVHNKGKKYN